MNSNPCKLVNLHDYLPQLNKIFLEVIIANGFDKDALKIIFKLLIKEGLFLGGSSGINVFGAIKLAQKLGPNHNIVTILCDSGQRYQSKIWNPEFLKSKNLPIPEWLN